MLPGLLGVLVRNERQRRDGPGHLRDRQPPRVARWRPGPGARSWRCCLAGNSEPASWVETPARGHVRGREGHRRGDSPRAGTSSASSSAPTQARPGIDHPGTNRGRDGRGDGSADDASASSSRSIRACSRPTRFAPSTSRSRCCNLDVVTPLVESAGRRSRPRRRCRSRARHRGRRRRATRRPRTSRRSIRRNAGANLASRGPVRPLPRAPLDAEPGQPRLPPALPARQTSRSRMRRSTTR